MNFTSSSQSLIEGPGGEKASRLRDRMPISPPKRCNATSLTLQSGAEVRKLHSSSERLLRSSISLHRNSGNSSATRIGLGWRNRSTFMERYYVQNERLSAR